MKVNKEVTIYLDTLEIRFLKELVSIGENKFNDCIRKNEMYMGYTFNEMQELLTFARSIGDL